MPASRASSAEPAPAPAAPAPLSYRQRRLWFLDRLAPGLVVEVFALSIDLQGAPAVAALARALGAVVARHAALRTTFGELDGEPYAVIHPPGPLRLSRIDLTAAAGGAAVELHGIERRESRRPCDLVAGPLLRALLVSTGARHHRLLLHVHPIVFDGASAEVLLAELAALYDAFAAGLPSPLHEPPSQYQDYVAWQRRRLRSDELGAQLAWWRDRLRGAPAALALPADRQRPAVQSHRRAACRRRLPGALAARLRSACRDGITLEVQALAAFAALLARHGGGEDLLIGWPVAHRDNREFAGLIGPLASTLALRLDLAGRLSWLALVRQARATAAAALARREVPFELLLEELQPVRDLSRAPLVQVALAARKVPAARWAGAAGGLDFVPLAAGAATVELDLALIVERGGERAGAAAAAAAGEGLVLEYATDLFSGPAAARLLERLVRLLSAAVAAPEAPLAALPLLSAAERHQVCVEWNDSGAVEAEPCLHELFERQAARSPERVAVVGRQESLTYGELERRSRLLAGALRRAGVGRERLVAVLLERSPELVVALLAVLRAGGAYVPIDARYPAARVELLLARSGAALVLARGALLAQFAAHLAGARPLLLTDAWWEKRARQEEESESEEPGPARPAVPGNLAYVIYTSGSTGVPKGVGIEHRSAVALAHWARQAFSPTELSGVLAATSVCFDLSVFELFVPLAWGGTVVMAADALELATLPETLRSRVRLINTVPSALAELVREQAVPGGVLAVNLAGEALPGALVGQLHAVSAARVLNLYGPSEDTTYSTWAEVGRGERMPPIGRPIAGTRAYVLDGEGAPAALGVAGELYLAGQGLARGYLGDPERTAERFVPDPFGGAWGSEPGGRLYRTGDLVRCRFSGEMEFLGRGDQQVKIRGFRIELGEVEAALAELPGLVESAVAVDREAEGSLRLVAYVVMAEGAPAVAAELRASLRQRLPDHLVPSRFVMLPALPRTPNGKLDRKALPAPEAADAAAAAAQEGRFQAPRGVFEELVAGIWGELFGRERIGAHDHFFALGGHSLLAMRVASRLRSALGVELPLRALFEAPTVAELARLLAAGARGGQGGAGAAPDLPPITRRPGGREAPLSFAQRRLWFLDQLAPGAAVYNEPSPLRLLGPLDLAALAAALAGVVSRHEVLRTTFARMEGGEPCQVIHPPGVVPLPRVDLMGLSAAAAERQARLALRAEAALPFDLAAGPLVRAALLELGSEEHLLQLTFHHIVFDGWSAEVLQRELAALYAAFAAPGSAGGPPGASAGLAELPIQYADFAAWQRRYLRWEEPAAPLAGQLAFWCERLAGAPAALELPIEWQRPAVQSHRGAVCRRRLPGELVARLRAGYRDGVTAYVQLLAAFAALLARHGGGEDLLIGSPVANRNRVEIEGLIGFFVNTLVMRLDLAGDPSWRTLLGRARDTAFSAFAHQDLPFETLVEELRPERDLSRMPLVQVLLALQNAQPHHGGERAAGLRGLRMAPFAVDAGTAKFDLALVVEECEAGSGAAASGWELALEYATDLFSGAAAAQLLARLVRLLSAAVAAPEAPISALPLLAEAERHQVSVEWNDSALAAGGAPAAGGALVQERFRAWAERAPEAVAVVQGGREVRYGELRARAEGLARALRRRGVGPEVAVAVCAERSVEMVLGALATLLAGGAYVPLDPGQPRERLEWMVGDCGAPVVLAQERFTAALSRSGAEVLALEGDWEKAAGPPAGERSGRQNLAYVIYTSGSTGRPKGVEVRHAALSNLVDWHCAVYGVDGSSRGTLVAGVGFDAAVWELWPYLAQGARVEVAEAETVASAERLRDWLVAGGATVSFLPTPLAEAVLELPWPVGSRLQWLLTGGDRLHRACPRESSFALINHYGPTEGAVVASRERVAGSLAAGVPPPIGRPIANVKLYVVDGSGRLVPAGVAGELWLGGAGLARGYRGRAALTAERFVPDPFGESPGGRLYRTGDRVRWLRDGRLEFLGRLDHQVKIRGLRIELGEIETVLREHPRIGQAVVVLREDGPGERRLVAYLTDAPAAAPPAGGTGEAGEPWTAAELRRHLRRRLPEFMVPRSFVTLTALPLTASGKVDRRALPAPAPDAHGGGAGTRVAPRTPLEELLAGIWSEVLGGVEVGVEDNFFDLGGHSLLATQMTSRLRSSLGFELPLRALFEAPTIAALAALMESAGYAAAGAPREQGGAATAPGLPPITCRPGGRAPLSFAQRRLWFFDQLTPGATVYNVPSPLHLRGPLDPAALAAALAGVVRRHEALRTRFVEVDGEPWQEVLPPRPCALPLVDLVRLAPPRRAAELARLASAEAARAFDLARGPLLRATLAGIAAEEHVLLLTLHHIVFDGWSEGVLLGELETLYAAARERRPSPLPEPPVQYADFAAWQRAWPREVLARQLAYWRRQLGGAPAALELPADRQRPPVQSFRGASRELRLPAELTALLRRTARREGVTLYMLLLAAFAALLARTTSQKDLLIGAPVANRTRSEIEGLIGFFVNTLVLRLRCDGDPELRRVLAAARDTALAAFAHEDLPFEALVEELQPRRDLSRNPLVQVLLVLQSAGQAAAPARTAANAGQAAAPAGTAANLRWQPLRLGASTTAKFDLALAVEEEQDGGAEPALRLDLEYASDLFTAAAAARLLAQFSTLLAGAAAAPELALSRLPLLSEAERHQLLEEWNDTASRCPPRPLHRLFAEQAAARPQAVAVAWEEGQWTYNELDRRSGAIARQLRRLGVGGEDLVGLCVERSPEMVAAVLGILKAGGAYLPLDPSYPRRRLELLLEDAAPAALVGSRRLLAALPGSAPRLALEEAAAIGNEPAADPEEEVSPERLAYVLYTSGSTGTPKAVAVTHQAVVRLVRDTRYASFGPGEVFLQVAPMAFDAATLELWGPLLNGGRLALFPPRPFSLAELGEAVARHGVSTLWLTAGLFHLAVDEGLERFRSLRQLLAGGDVLSPDHVERALAALPGVELINGYGPTENTTFSCCHRIRGGPGPGAVPIGRPIASSRALVLDSALAPMPIGCVGELYVGGAGLARGYLRRPELTAERFVPDPAGQGARLYRTGDLARWRPDGTLDFRGRADSQVKIRGFRVEPGEVESVLLRHPGVRQAVVAAFCEGSGERRLAAYYVTAAAAEVDTAELRAFLRERLPEPMLPAAFVQLAALPLTPNGKLDRKALPAPDVAEGAAGGAKEGLFRAPRGVFEELVAGIWGEALGGVEIGVEDNFFDLGGHSLLAMRVASRLRSALGFELPLRALFEAPTVAELARLLAAIARGGQGGATAVPGLPPITRQPVGGEAPLSFAQRRLWFLDQLTPGSTAFSLLAPLDLTGPLDPAALAAALAEVMRRHEALRTVFVKRGGEPWQRVLRPPERRLPIVDLTGLPAGGRQGVARRLAEEEARRPFDLARGPLLRTALARLGPERHLLLLSLHHIVTDGWSNEVLQRELVALYGAFARRLRPPLGELPIQYLHYAVWQARWFGADVLAGAVERWRRYFGGRALPAPWLPTDGPSRSARSTGDAVAPDGTYRQRILAPELARQVRALGRTAGTTLFMTLLAGFDALLHRLSGEERVVVGSPVAGRDRAELEGLIGCFVNTVVLPVDCGGDPNFRTLLERVRETALAAYSLQDLPFEKLVEAVHPERRGGSTPLFRVMFAFHSDPGELPVAAGVHFVSLRMLGNGTAQFDLTLYLMERGGELAAVMEYRTALFASATIDRLLAAYEDLLAAAVAAPETPLSRLPVPPGLVRRRPAGEPMPAPQARPAHLAERQERLASRLAGLSAEQRTALAGRLRAEPGVAPGGTSADSRRERLLARRADLSDEQRRCLEHRLRGDGEASGKPRRTAVLVEITPPPALATGVAARPPLACVHPAGGDVLCFFPLARHLGPDQPCYGLQSLGLGPEEEPLRRIEEMAERYVGELRRAQPRGPYLLAGWSFGGLAAFEMAQQLRAVGEEVALLAVLDTGPGLPQTEVGRDTGSALAGEESAAGATATPWEAADGDLAGPLLEIARYVEGLWGKQLRLGAADLAGLEGEEQLRLFVARARAAGLLHQTGGLEQLRRQVEVLRSNARAYRGYRLHPYAGRLTLVRAVDGADREAADRGADARRAAGAEPVAASPESVTAGPDLGWGRWAAAVDRLEAPGDHISLLAEPHVGVLAGLLRAAIDRALRPAGGNGR
jgi:amino acid adenylation domain-containing protein